jgi:hypothetical protein
VKEMQKKKSQERQIQEEMVVEKELKSAALRKVDEIREKQEEILKQRRTELQEYQKQQIVSDLVYVLRGAGTEAIGETAEVPGRTGGVE